jgi:hypothetical protein
MRRGTEITNEAKSEEDAMTTTTTTETYTDAQATDEAVLLLTRKLRRLHPDAYADLMKRLPERARDALNQADVRADHLRAADQRDGITREYRDWQAEIEAEIKADEAAA